MIIRLEAAPRVLYVGDSPEDGQAVKFDLRDVACVTAFSNPNEALDALRAGTRADVAVCVLEMPGMDSLALLRQIDRIDPCIVGIIITKLADDHDRVIFAKQDAYVWRIYVADQFFDGKTMASAVLAASEEHARRLFKHLREKHQDEIKSRLSAEGAEECDLPELLRTQEILVCQLVPFLDLSDLDRFLLMFAANCYDIGRRVAPDDHKQERGAAVRILSGLDGLEKVLEAARDWRECFDGSGPQGKRGNDIPLFARIIAVVDEFARLVGGAEGKGAGLAAQSAVEQIRSLSGSRFDPEMVGLLDQLVREARKSLERRGHGGADLAAVLFTSPHGDLGAEAR